MKKVRKQACLDVWQEERLLELARKADVPVAEIIRAAIDAYLLATGELPPDRPLSDLAGIGVSRKGDFGASEHDRAVYDR